ncbi:MAG: hypothetical protein KDL31_05305 [Kiritimatiellae bacterium]|nr:hypothetical protein [Kiritimatiellia bacterium]
MPAFCYVRHDDNPGNRPMLAAMAASLAPARLKGTIHQFRVPNGTLLAWTADHTPFDLFTGPDGGVAMLLGEALCNHTPHRISAADLYGDWPGVTRASGYFCWLVIRGSGELFAGTDPFGLFPLYSTSNTEVFALASSINTLRQHPRYDRTPDLVGLARHLIENGCASSRTVERGSRRIQPGQVVHLHASPSLQPALLDHSIDWLSEDKITDPREAVALSISMSEAAYQRHTRTDSQAMLMSGGLDTRQLAALAIRSGHRPDGYTYGEPTDFEAVQARRTCRQVGGRWHILPDQMPPAGTMIEEELDLLSLAGGFSTVTMTGFESLGRAAIPRVTTGLLLDVHYSPFYRAPSTYEEDSLPYCMDVWINRFGIPADRLLDMARPGDMRKAVREALHEIESEWASLCGDLADRHWQVLTRHRMRPHLGSHLWKVAFHTWPQLIATDVPFVKATRRVSGDLLRDRFLQRQTVADLSPKLARIPLDSMHNQPHSVLPSRWNHLYHRMHMARLRLDGKTAQDAHRYPRIMGIDTPAWREIRAQAEAGREAAETLFEADKLRAYLPAYPEPPAPERQTFAGQWGLRLAMGMMLWLKARG